LIVSIKATDLQNHQSERIDQGWAESTIDQEIGAVRTMIQLAIDDDKISGDAIKPFRKVNRLIKGNSNAREKIIPLACKIKGNPYNLLKVTPKGIHDNHVFLYQGRPLTRIRNGFKKACEDVVLIYGRFKKDGFIFHDLRHCFNTYMRRAGVDPITIMKIVGHSPGRSLEMNFRYNVFELDDLKIAIKKLKN